MTKRKNQLTHRTAPAFTLIEMLVVIAVIGILATIFIGMLPRANVLKTRGRVQAELSQIQTAIDSYKQKRGFYPPDHPANPGTNSLFYELSGTVFDGAQTYTTITKSDTITVNTIKSVFGVDGFVNSNSTPDGDAQNYHRALNPLRQSSTSLVPGVRLLGMSLRGPGTTDFCPWVYNSSAPVHNPNGYDLWVDVLLNGKVKRFGNWKED